MTRSACASRIASLPAIRSSSAPPSGTDLPTGDPEALYDSLFSRVLRLDPELKVFLAHEYKGRGHSLIAQEVAENPHLQQHDRAAFVASSRVRGREHPKSNERERQDRTGRVFDRVERLDEVPDGYRAMSECEAIKVMAEH